MKIKAICMCMSSVIAAVATVITVGTTAFVTTVSSKPSNLKPITFTMYGGSANSAYENYKSPVAREIKKRTGVTLKIEYSVGDNQQKMGVMIASGKLPDLVDASTAIYKLINVRKIIKLGPLINKYAPNIKKFYGKYYNRLQYSIKDKNIYAFPDIPLENVSWVPTIGFNLQHAVVKELGYPKIVTVKDYEDAIRKYMLKHPTINGQKTIGVSLLGDDWRYYITVTNPATEASGYPNDGGFIVDPKTYKCTGLFLSDGMKQYVKWLNHLNAIGLLDPESFIQKFDQYKAKISSGRVLGTIDATWDIEDAQRVLRKEKMDERTYGQYPCVLKKGIKNTDLVDNGFSPNGGICITTDCKDPVRAIKFFDFLCSERGEILRNWGIEGKNYDIINGKRIITSKELKERNTDPYYYKRTGIGVYGQPFPVHGNGIKDQTGQYYQPISPEMIQKGYSDIEKEVLRHYGVKMWYQLYPQTEELPKRKWGAGYTISSSADSKWQLIQTKIDNLERQAIPEAIMRSPADFETVWKEFVEKQEELGIHEAEKEFQRYVKERISLWYGK